MSGDVHGIPPEAATVRHERWFDECYSESFFGWGHQDKAEFAEWCNQWLRENDMRGEATFVADDVVHRWAEGSEDWEEFKVTDEKQPDACGYQSRPITQVRP